MPLENTFGEFPNCFTLRYPFDRLGFGLRNGRSLEAIRLFSKSWRILFFRAKNCQLRRASQIHGFKASAPISETGAQGLPRLGSQGGREGRRFRHFGMIEQFKAEIPNNGLASIGEAESQKLRRKDCVAIFDRCADALLQKKLGEARCLEQLAGLQCPATYQWSARSVAALETISGSNVSSRICAAFMPSAHSFVTGQIPIAPLN